MGRIDSDDAVKTARRFADAQKQQAATRDDVSDAKGLDRRRDFMRASGRVFFESIIEGSDLFPMRYLGVGQLAARAVGRIHLPPTDGYGDGYATGFLVAPNVLLTNQHVLRTIDWARVATLTMDAEDGLDALPKPPRLFRFNPDALYVADSDLDFCFVAVAPRSVDGYALAEYGYLRLFSMSGKIVRDEYASIVQHPNGRQKHLAIRNNKITIYVYDDDLTRDQQAQNNFLYYSTDTLRGSSGSPVLSDQWYVIALHRRGVPEVTVRDGAPVIMRRNGSPAFEDDPDEVVKYVSNEGTRISRILKRVAAIGETEGRADRSAARALFQTLTDAAGKVSDGPCSFPSAVLPLPAPSRGGIVRPGGIRPRVAGLDDEGLEITHRNLGVFPEGTGYDENFLEGHPIPLPRPSNHLAAELARRTDKPDTYLLPFRHFTTAVHAGRRLPVFAAVNIAGTQRPSGRMPQRPQWSYDPRIAEEHQPDDSIFSSMLQRGHMAARDYVFWGDGEERTEADVHSFTLTNVCPQIADFNGHREWYEVEREVVGGAKGDKARVTEFVGPILRATDPDYDDLRGSGSTATRGTRIRIPLKFWKLIVWVEQGQLRHRALILDQRDELEEAGPLELDIAIPEGVQETTVARIAELTDLHFEGLQG